MVTLQIAWLQPTCFHPSPYCPISCLPVTRKAPAWEWSVHLYHHARKRSKVQWHHRSLANSLAMPPANSSDEDFNYKLPTKAGKVKSFGTFGGCTSEKVQLDFQLIMGMCFKFEGTHTPALPNAFPRKFSESLLLIIIHIGPTQQKQFSGSMEA